MFVRDDVSASRLCQVTDYVPNPNAVDELMDKLTPALAKVTDKVCFGILRVWSCAFGAQDAS